MCRRLLAHLPAGLLLLLVYRLPPFLFHISAAQPSCVDHLLRLDHHFSLQTHASVVVCYLLSWYVWTTNSSSTLLRLVVFIFFGLFFTIFRTYVYIVVGKSIQTDNTTHTHTHTPSYAYTQRFLTEFHFTIDLFHTSSSASSVFQLPLCIIFSPPSLSLSLSRLINQCFFPFFIRFLVAELPHPSLLLLALSHLFDQERVTPEHTNSRRDHRF